MQHQIYPTAPAALADAQPRGSEPSHSAAMDGEQAQNSSEKPKSVLGKVKNKAKKLKDKFKQVTTTDSKDESQENDTSGSDNDGDETSNETISSDQVPYQQLRSIGDLGSDQNDNSDDGAPVKDYTNPTPGTYWGHEPHDAHNVSPYKSAGPPDALQAVPTGYRNDYTDVSPDDSGSVSLEFSQNCDRKSAIDQTPAVVSVAKDRFESKDLSCDSFGSNRSLGNSFVQEKKALPGSLGATKSVEDVTFPDDIVKPNLSFGETCGLDDSDSGKIGVQNFDEESKVPANAPVPEDDERASLIQKNAKVSSNRLPEAVSPETYRDYGNTEGSLENSLCSTDVSLSTGSPTEDAAERLFKATSKNDGRSWSSHEDDELKVKSDDAEGAEREPLHRRAHELSSVKDQNSDSIAVASGKIGADAGICCNEGRSSFEDEQGDPSAKESIVQKPAVSEKRSWGEWNSVTPQDAKDLASTDKNGESYHEPGIREAYNDPDPLVNIEENKDASIDLPQSSLTDRATDTLFGLKNVVVSTFGYGSTETSESNTTPDSIATSKIAKTQDEDTHGQEQLPLSKRVAGTAMELKDTVISKLRYGSDKGSEEESAAIDEDGKSEELPESTGFTDTVGKTVQGLKDAVTSKVGYGESKSGESCSSVSVEENTGTGSSYTQKIMDTSAAAKNYIASKAGYGESKTDEQLSVLGDEIPGRESSYMQKMIDTTGAAKEDVASKAGYERGDDAGGGDEEPSNEELSKGLYKGIGSSIASRLSPGEEDKALSDLITETVSNGAATVKQKLGAGFSILSPKSAAVRENVNNPTTPEPASPASGVLGRVTNAVSSYLGKQPAANHIADEMPKQTAQEENTYSSGTLPVAN